MASFDAVDGIMDQLDSSQIYKLARAALISEAYHQADIGGTASRGFEQEATDHLTNVTPPVWDAVITRDADTFMYERDHFDDVARANAYRKMLGMRPVNNDGKLED